MGVGLGAFRIVTGTPLVFYILAAYVAVIALTLRSGRTIIPLAYDSGGVSTSIGPTKPSLAKMRSCIGDKDIA